jgi:FeS assembly SUF system protein
MMEDNHDLNTANASNTDEQASAQPTPSGGANNIRDEVVQMLSTIFDPEIPVNIYELGLIYEVEVNSDGDTIVTMTLTTPNCPVAGSMPGEVESKVNMVPGVRSAEVNLVWDPPWTPERMSEAAKLELGFI